MTVAPPQVAPVHDPGMNGNVPGHHHHHPHHQPNGHLPRFHPIAMNPNQPVHPEHMPMPNHPHFRPYAPPPPMHEAGPPPPPAMHPGHIDHIEARLRQLEHEEASRMAARSHLLAIRKREDEEFRRMTENAEAEEEDLRRQRKRLKRESMGLGFNATLDSPPMRPTPPRRLSETNAATTLAFFKQQSPPEPRSIPPPVQAPPHHPPPPPQHLSHDSNGGTIRRKQKYTIKNVEAWGERHGRPAAHDPSGRALWKRPSDGSLVYLTCPVPGCGKADFVTLHGFMCHLTKKHKDRSLGSQSRALEVCGLVYDPNAPLPPVSAANRASTEESRLESEHPEGYHQEIETSSVSDDGEPSQDRDRPVKTEAPERSLPAPTAPFPPPDEPIKAPRLNGHISTKQSISSIIDREPPAEEQLPAPAQTQTQTPSQSQSQTPRERLNSLPPRPTEPPAQASPQEQKPAPMEVDSKSHESEKENTEPKESSEEK